MSLTNTRQLLASPPLWAVCLLALVWLLPGLFGSEPWKPDGAYTFGLISHISNTGDWVVPTLAGEPFMEKPPLYFITAALLNNALGGWLLAPVDAMRLATGLYIGLAMLGIALAARELFGRGYGRWAVIILLGCLGFPVRAHQLITDTALFAGIAWATYGLVLAPRRPRLAGVLLGAGVAVALLSKGLIGPGVVGLTALLLPALSPAYRTRRHALTLLIALLVFLPLPALWMSALYQRSPELFHTWWWDNNFGRFFGTNHLGPRATHGFYFKLLPWYALPAWPLVLYGAWCYFRDKQLLRLVAPGVFFIIGFSVLSAASDARELYGMPLLVPLSLLAVAGVRETATLRVPGRVLWALIALLVLGLLLLGGYALATGAPAKVYAVVSRRFGGWQPHWVPLAWVAAGLLLLGLYALWQQAPTQRLSGGLWRWAVLLAGIWGMLGTVYLPALDEQMAYRLPFRMLRHPLHLALKDGCVASLRLGEPQRALLSHYGRAQTLRLETQPAAGQCRWLLVQSENGWAPHFSQPLQPQLVVARPGDDKERYLLYALPQPLAQMGLLLN
ncbi:4-amino-4-deoxy-L-arabinose transferase [Andreprevotia lacus DSM 23236]|jgi:4-amino-4-deoxy-L-arabinose transferase-like glycosyltransferase|uniref:4-amino-4-deoxy-L-arabinose transferase n=1 Tax=Andreprevotia lacus DSM 23236 TaxID=1121001 RepID=A0A1W1X6Y0_9NEIS|nr:glycosyltransferase family 39 protein [Andreprevotia lacus]SMC19241.1 4-amino-4-deoxy-L-arabinose transferase [Andreprevotia lacus DSM 23236]